MRLAVTSVGIIYARVYYTYTYTRAHEPIRRIRSHVIHDGTLGIAGVDARMTELTASQPVLINRGMLYLD